MTYSVNSLNRPIRVYREVDSHLILNDLYAKLALFIRKHPELSTYRSDGMPRRGPAGNTE